MFTGSGVQVLSAIQADPLTIRLANAMDRHLQEKIISKGYAKLDITVIRDFFLVQFFFHACFKNVQLFELSIHMHGHWFQAAAALTLKVCFQLCL